MSGRVLTFGTFDMLHLGHIRFLRRCAELGPVTVGLGTAEYVTEYKREPVQEYELRAATLKELPFVDSVVPRPKVDTKSLIPYVEPKFLAAGTDWIGLEYLTLSGINPDYLEHHEITLVYFPRTLYVSTTQSIADVLRKKGGEGQSNLSSN